MNRNSMAGQLPKFALGVSDFSTSEPLENSKKIISYGMNFIEPGLAKIAAMTDFDFFRAATQIKQNEIRVQSVNWFLPPDLKVIGPEADDNASRRFLEHALARAVTLGAKAVVFGSPGSRSIPSGFSASIGRQQMIAFCRLCSDVISENEWPLKIAVEHVNHTETNFINTFSQALSVVREIDRPQIGLAADFYHFAIENESMDVMLDAADLICAVQLADPNGRCFPKPGAEIPGLETFFKNLVEIGYQGGVSVEATVGQDLETDCRGAVQRLKAVFA